MEILCFYAGIAFVYLEHSYPLIFIFILFYFRAKWAYVIWFVMAMLWCLFHQFMEDSRGMPNTEIIQQADLIGKVISIPAVQGDKVQFSFAAETLNGKPVTTHIAIACYSHCPDFHSGQYWHLMAKLKKPRNLGNPGHFNYVNWLNARHIHWSGTLLNHRFPPVIVKTRPSVLLNIREQLLKNISLLDPDEKTLGIIQALTLGVTNYIDKSQWDLFRHTGTVHLIDISGAHIGMVAGMTFMVVKWLWSRLGRVCLYWPAPKVASMVSLAVATGYTLISGYAIPAQRALIACMFMLFRNFFSQRFSVWQSWRYALFFVLVSEPHSVMMAGFYLSFLGVAILVLVNQRIIATGIRKQLLLQVACLLGLMPLTLFMFSYGSINGLIANIVAIPWVEMLIVPLALIVTFLSSSFVIPGSVFVLKKSILLLLFFLKWVDSFAMLNLTFTFNQLLSPLAFMFILCFLLFFPLTRLTVPICMMGLAALFPSYLNVKSGEARIDILDVGQGLAVVINTTHHVLVYDTGVKFFEGNDMGKIAIIPYLKTLGIKKLDKVVISHPDLDHRGGLASLEESFPIGELIVDEPKFYHRGSACHDYPSWQWDNVSFRFFSIADESRTKNNHSCVLQISTANRQILLTGDIEKQAEDYLVSKYGRQLASSIMVIPHHASKTSSSPAFVATVAPQFAVVSYGFDNRYHFPHRQAIQTYEQRHIPIFDTVSCGMVTVLLSKKGNQPRCNIA